MGRRCCVKSCDTGKTSIIEFNKKNSIKQTTLFKAPKCDLSRQNWTKFLKQIVNKEDYVCEKHFSAEQISKENSSDDLPDKTERGKVMLVQDAVPTILNHKTQEDSNKETAAYDTVPKPNFGLLVDIDGVITREDEVLPSVRDAFKRLTDPEGQFHVPTLFVTNNGSSLPGKIAKRLSKWTGVDVQENQVILSHGPLAAFQHLRHKRLLVIGQGDYKKIAAHYGFTNTVTIDDLRAQFPNLAYMDKKHRDTRSGPIDSKFESIEGIVILNEPTNWDVLLQIVIDLLITDGNPTFNPEEYPDQHIPVIACGMDLLWFAQAPIPRFGNGALLTCLEALYLKTTGKNLKYTALLGKPSTIVYQFAAQRLIENAAGTGIGQNLKRVYMIGDSINSDIYGANLFNKFLSGPTSGMQESSLHVDTQMLRIDDNSDCMLNECISVLVNTGVHRANSKINHHHSPRDFLPLDEDLCQPNYEAKDFGAAVNLIFKKEKYER